MKYSIDTSALIDAFRVNHPPDVFPGVWTCLGELVRDRILGASEEVLHELEQRDDELLAWVRKTPSMFRPTDLAIQLKVQQVLQSHPTLVNTKSDRQSADPFVVAVALVEGCAVVASEKPNPNKPRIPDACQANGVPYMSLVGMFREERKTFR